MNTYYGQYIRNRYPEYSRIRNDDNSVGGKIFDTIGNYFQLQLNELKKRNFNNRAIENLPILEPEAYYEIQLNQNDSFSTWISNEANEINNLTVKGFRNSNLNVLTKAETLNSFLELAPTGIDFLSKEEELNFDKNLLFVLNKEENIYNGEFYLGEKGHHIYINIPKEWINENDQLERLFYDSDLTKPFFQYNYFVTIRGIDIADKEVEETINIGIDTIYRSKTKFKYLKSLVPDNTKRVSGSFLLERSGFQSPIFVYLFYNESKEILRYDMLDLVLNKRIEKQVSSIWSDCYFSLEKKDNRSFLNYNFCLFNESQLPIFNKYDFFNSISYSDIQSKSFFKLIEQELFLPEGFAQDEFIEDFTIDIQRNKIIAVTNLLKVIYYDIGKNSFENPSFGRTKQISLEIESSNQRVSFGEERILKLFNTNFDFKIDKLCIFRKTPFANSNQIQFLNNDFEWQFSPYIFDDKLYYSSDFIKQQFADYDFINKIKIPVLFNVPGQWDFYVLSFNRQNLDLYNLLNQIEFNGDQFNFYLKTRSADNLTNPIHEFELNYKSFYVENNLPIRSFNLFSNFQDFMNDGIDIENIKINLEMNSNNSILYFIITDLTNEKVHIYKSSFHSDVFFYDIGRKTIFVQEDYDNVIIDINNGSLTFSILRENND